MFSWVSLLLLLGLCGFDQDDCSDYKKDLDELTRLLCEAGKVYRKEQEPSKELLKWWKEHQKKDKKKNR